MGLWEIIKGEQPGIIKTLMNKQISIIWKITAIDGRSQIWYGHIKKNGGEIMNISIESQYKKALEKHLNIEIELQSLPCGYISKKVIHGKTQYYLQRRSGKKIIGKYIPDDEVKAIEKGLSKRDALESQLLALNARISELESAAKLIDLNLYKNTI